METIRPLEGDSQTPKSQSVSGSIHVNGAERTVTVYTGMEILKVTFKKDLFLDNLKLIDDFVKNILTEGGPLDLQLWREGSNDVNVDRELNKMTATWQNKDFSFSLTDSVIALTYLQTMCTAIDKNMKIFPLVSKQIDNEIKRIDEESERIEDSEVDEDTFSANLTKLCQLGDRKKELNIRWINNEIKLIDEESKRVEDNEVNEDISANLNKLNQLSKRKNQLNSIIKLNNDNNQFYSELNKYKQRNS